MKSQPQVDNDKQLVRVWSLPSGATLGSSVRAAGIFLEVRSRLAGKTKKALTIKSRELILRMPEDATDQFVATAAVVALALDGIESLPVIPREIEDILGITSTERYRWLADGRLPSAGTRTVALRGRARKITFHVFDPEIVLDVLDRGLVDTWREDDAITATENRRRAAWKAKLTREGRTRPPASERDRTPSLVGWEEFERDGLLRSTSRNR
jgi:hypothetical protein